MKKLTLVLYGLLVLQPAFLGIVKAAGSPNISQVLISSVRVNSTKEYIEITNNSDSEIDVDGWRGTYTNATGGNLKTVFVLSGLMSAHESVVFASPDYITLHPEISSLMPLLYSGMADSGGYVLLYQKTEISPEYPDGFMLIQTLGWSAQASTNPQVVLLTGTSSLKRCSDIVGNYRPEKDTTDFIQVSSDMIFMDGPLCSDIVVPVIEIPPDSLPPAMEEPTLPIVETPPVIEVPETPVIDPPIIEEPAIVPLHCQGVVISEILPNPDGDDVDREFIELYNSTNSAVALDGCSLELNTTTKNTLNLFDLSIEPKKYLVLTAFTSNLVLPNASGGSLTLLEGAIEIDATDYPGDMDDDQSWALSDTGYASTFSPTPGSENIITSLKACDEGYVRNTETGRCNKIPEVTLPVVCTAGYVLNGDTGRCNKVEAETLVADCPAGQERNPQTNRCRTVVITASLVPCTAGQERNPLTNRCRSIESATSQFAECKEGQERNPDTNRCRTVVLGTTADGESLPIVMDVEVPRSQSVGILGIFCAIALAVLYALYEWRTEIAKSAHNMISILMGLFRRNKFMNKS